MRTWLQRNEGRRTTCLCACLAQCFSFGVWPSARLSPTAPDKVLVLVDNDATDGRIRPHVSETALGQCERHCHVSFVAVRGVLPAFGFGLAQLADDGLEILRFAEVSIDRRKPYIGNRVEIA